MIPDPTLARIREARHRISEKCGHDPRRLVEYYMEVQKQYSDRLVWPSKQAPIDAAADVRSGDEKE